MNSLEPIGKIAEYTFRGGYVSSAPHDRGDVMSKGSENVIFTGSGKTQVFKGMTRRGSQDGGGVFSTVVETFASLGQASDAVKYGNVFNVFAALFFIGAGLLRLTGQSLLVNATATLSLLIKRNGSYTDPASGPWQAGLAQPSAPVIRAIAPPAGFTGKVSGVVSIVIWRIRSTTGARSVKSVVSNIVGATNQSIAITLPLPDANGQDYWGIGGTRHGEGSIGSHFEIAEIPESEVSEHIMAADVVTTGGSPTISSASGGFNSSHLGWKVVLSGGSPTVTLTSYVVEVTSATQLKLADNVPVSSSNVSMDLIRGVDGQARTIVVEWRDGDLTTFAPTRDYPPPAGLFAGTLEDVVFIDGAYGDAVQTVSSNVRGSAICPSEPGRPESFAADTAVFTNDSPTALIRGEGHYWRFGRNTLYIIRYVGGNTPLSIESVWTGTGIEYQNNACIGEGGRLYLWAEAAFRMGSDGLPDSEFANDVAEELAECTDAKKKVLGWDGRYKVICYCYEKTIYPYFVTQGRWGSPLNLNGQIQGDIQSCVTENNKMLLSSTDGIEDFLYEFNVGTGTVAKIMSGWTPARASLETVHSVMCAVRADNTANPVIIEVFADGDEAIPQSTDAVTPARTGYSQLLPVRPNVTDCESFAIRITITSNTAGGDVGIEYASVHGEGTSILR